MYLSTYFSYVLAFPECLSMSALWKKSSLILFHGVAVIMEMGIVGGRLYTVRS